ncbi:MAG: ATP-dependent Clp protease adapter ClpS [Bdellovibrio sp. CG10_big_fil_rev_8_21_14_0_10_47_8]|nr:MAG: ATP-dependent Clp protease adapter ClpS [Bdellovibrio sp. CG10_big_fil_rev_8_21_14_0_10_47_8]
MKLFAQLSSQHRLPVFQNSGEDGDQPHGDGAVETIDRLDTPKMYKVILLNDDFTPMDFVVMVLRRFFNKSEEEATAVMLDVHKKGAGIAGVFTLEMAEMKTMQVNQFARSSQQPLKCTLEPE